MNALIETLNRFGGNALHFAWPMLWQSSLLIAILFVADFTLRRRVRAAVRYALWLVLLVKLLLPPSLALRTGVAWWLHLTPQTSTKPQPTKYVVRSGSDPTPDSTFQPATAFVPLPRPPLSGAAWAMVGWSVISTGLLASLIWRWRQVARYVQRSTTPPARLNELFDEAQRAVGLRRAVRFRLTNQAMSPAVCGLFCPVILLPQSLTEKLPPNQLPAVLLHELTHLRRGDVWMNCAQALVQIVYWWHPLLWLANARIRRVREEAVDDAVMLALRDDAETYAPTLLEVAKLAFNRPLASLGLVGILESRNALRQRIERLVNFRAPRKAGLSIGSLLGILAFTALAVPMGEAPAESTGLSTSRELQTLTLNVNPDVFIRNVKAQAANTLHASSDSYTDILLDVLMGDGVDCVPPHGIAFNTKTGEITTQNTPEALDIFRQVIEQLNRTDGKCALPLGFSSFHRKDVLITAQFYKMRTTDFENLVQGLDMDNDKYSGVSRGSVSPEHFKEFGERTKSLGLDPFNSARIQTGHGITASLYTGTSTNSVALDCRSFITIDGTHGMVNLAVRASTTGQFTDNPAGDWPSVDGMTNCAFNASVSAEDHGGIVLRAENPSGSVANNLVVVLGVQIITTNVSTGFRERLEAVITRANAPPGTNFGKTEVVPDASRNAPPLVVNGITNKPASNAGVSTNLSTRTFKLDTNTFLANLAMVRIQSGFTNDADLGRAFRNFFACLGVDLSPPKAIFFNYGPGLLLVRATSRDLDIIESAIQTVNTTPAQIHIKARFIEVPEDMAINHLGANFIPTAVPNVAGVLNGPDLLLLIHALEQSKGTETLAEPEVTTTSGRQTQMRATIFPSDHYYLANGKEVGPKPGDRAKALLAFITVTLVDPAGNRLHSDDKMPFAGNSIPPQDSH